MPIPQGKYKPAIRHHDVIYVSGMTPRLDGELQYSGKIKTTDVISDYREAVRLATGNALIAARQCLRENEELSVILQLQVFINAEENFGAHAKVADFASEFLIENIGAACIGSRAAIGVASLPSNAPVEITLTAMVQKNPSQK